MLTDAGRGWRLRAALAVTALAWGAAGMVVLIGLNLVWVESLHGLGISTARLALLGRVLSAGWGGGEAVWAWVLREGLDGVLAVARAHPGMASAVGLVPVGGVAVGPGALVIAIALTVAALRLLARR